MDTNSQIPSRPPSDEIDIAELIRHLWAGKCIILITTVVFLAAGIAYSLYQSANTVKEYQSRVTLFAGSPAADSLLKVFSYPPFFADILEIRLAGDSPDGPGTVKQALDRQTPAAGTVASLMKRVTATVGEGGTLVISAEMQDPSAAGQLADSVVTRLTQFLEQEKEERIEEVKGQLREDSVRTIQSMTELSKRNLQLQATETAKNVQLLSTAFQQAESMYLRARQALTHYYNQHAAHPASIDTLEVRQLNADIEMKYKVYGDLYEQLEQAKVYARIAINKAQLEADRQLDQAKADARRHLDSVVTGSRRQQTEITILEPASGAIPVNTQKPFKIPLIMLFFGVIAGVGIVFGRRFYVNNFTGVNRRG